MNIRNDRMERLVKVARLYYEQDRTQSDIAKDLGVSRPLVSRLLSEAKAMGIVEVRIHTDNPGGSPLLTQARNRFNLQGGVLIPDGLDGNLTNQSLAESAVTYIQQLGGGRLGIGWGHVIGVMVSLLEDMPPYRGKVRDICPLVGNSGISIRNYHSNENVRILAQQLQAAPHYLYSPAFAENRQELDLLSQTEHYRAVYREWERLDVALVNIGNYPSTPDFASVARYGKLLSEEHAVGRIIAHHFNLQGEVIRSETDYAIQIPIPVLANCKHVVGICSSNVNPTALAGALNTGLVTDLIVREGLLREVLEARH